MQRISPFLWFNHQAEDAATFYTSIFKDSKILSRSYYGDAGPGPKGSVMTVSFNLNGQEFVALNGGPHFKFTEAVSFVVNCETQEEVDYFWEKLSSGGEEVECGWLKDRYGLSWQIVPTVVDKLITDTDREKANRVMTALLNMKKLIIADLEKAYRGE